MTSLCFLEWKIKLANLNEESKFSFYNCVDTNQNLKGKKRKYEICKLINFKHTLSTYYCYYTKGYPPATSTPTIDHSLQPSRPPLPPPTLEIDTFTLTAPCDGVKRHLSYR